MTNLESKRKFYMTNRDVFLRYFEDNQQYQAMINAGAFEKMERIISEGRTDRGKSKEDFIAEALGDE